MRPLLQEISTAATPESLVENLHGERTLLFLLLIIFSIKKIPHPFVFQIQSFIFDCFLIKFDDYNLVISI